jgi:hypothetical protein
MLCMVSPLEDNFGETLSSLRFAARAKEIPTHAEVKAVAHSSLLLAFDDERGQQRSSGYKTFFLNGVQNILRRNLQRF